MLIQYLITTLIFIQLNLIFFSILFFVSEKNVPIIKNIIDYMFFFIFQVTKRQHFIPQHYYLSLHCVMCVARSVSADIKLDINYTYK